MDVISISNGHGEDEIAVRICRSLANLGCFSKALPLVGQGNSYRLAEIELIKDSVKSLPTGGFVRMDWRELWRDVQAGLIGLTWKQLRSVWKLSHSNQLILAVGDIVPLIFAWICSFRGASYVFVATAKSEYYWREQGQRPPWGGSIFYPWERWLMSQKSCKLVIVRDALTCSWLKKRCRGHVVFLGNPMMDDLAPQNLPLVTGDDHWVVTILPGSRAPEAYSNFRLLLQLADNLRNALNAKVVFLVAIFTTLDRQMLISILEEQGWQKQDNDRFIKERGEIVLVSDGFADCLHLCHFGLAMAGTGTEQLVGKGKPVFTLPGTGPQFTRRFAEEQTYLLGSSIVLLDNVDQFGVIIKNILNDPDFFQNAVINGKERMGDAGASDRIAELITGMF